MRAVTLESFEGQPALREDVREAVQAFLGTHSQGKLGVMIA